MAVVFLLLAAAFPGGWKLLAHAGFEPGEEARFLLIRREWAKIASDPKLVLSGRGSLLVDTTKSKGMWHEFLHTDPRRLPLKPGWVYKVRLRYRVVSLGGGSYFYLMARTYAVPSRLFPFYDRGHKAWRGKPGEKGLVESVFSSGPKRGYFVVVGVHRRGALVVDDFEVWERPPEDVEFGPPEPLAPLDGQRLSKEAFSLSWFAPVREGWRPLRYEVELRKKGSRKTLTVEVDDSGADVVEWFPEEPPVSEGTWLWRVRAINALDKPGKWSEERRFTIEPPASPRPPRREISPRRPLFLFLAKDDARVIRERWATIPAELRPFSGFRIGTSAATLLRFLREMSRDGGRIPCYLQVSGPNDVRKGRKYTVPLPLVEHAFRNFPFVEGAVLVEQYGAHEGRRQYLAHLLPVAAKYGRRVIWAHKHGPKVHEFVVLLADPGWFEPIRRFGRYFVPVWKMNGPASPLLAHSCCLGLWLSSVTEAWGVEPESWYWHEAGFGGEAEFPPLCWGQMMLMGLSSGATCYIFEPPWRIWGGDNKLTSVAREVVLPLLSDIVRHDLIPAKEDVLPNVKFGYVASEADVPCSRENTYGRLWPLFREAYGLDDQRLFLPRRLPCFFLPVFPAPHEGLPEGVELLRDPEEAARRLSPSVESVKGALCVKVGRLTVVISPLLRGEGGAPFEVEFKGGPIARASGELLPRQYAVFKQEGGRSLFAHLNAGEGRALKMELLPRGEVLLDMEGGRAMLLPTRGGMLMLKVSGQASILLRGQQ